MSENASELDDWLVTARAHLRFIELRALIRSAATREEKDALSDEWLAIATRYHFDPSVETVSHATCGTSSALVNAA